MNDARGTASQREALALAAIKQAFGTADDEYGATLFVHHHLAEIGADYWIRHLGTARPQPQQVLDILVVTSDSGDEQDDVDSVDFSLPEQVSDAVICVHFDASGRVDEIVMES